MPIQHGGHILGLSNFLIIFSENCLVLLPNFTRSSFYLSNSTITEGSKTKTSSIDENTRDVPFSKHQYHAISRFFQSRDITCHLSAAIRQTRKMSNFNEALTNVPFCRLIRLFSRLALIAGNVHDTIENVFCFFAFLINFPYAIFKTCCSL